MPCFPSDRPAGGVGKIKYQIGLTKKYTSGAPLSIGLTKIGQSLIFSVWLIFGAMPVFRRMGALFPVSHRTEPLVMYGSAPLVGAFANVYPAQWTSAHTIQEFVQDP